MNIDIRVANKIAINMTPDVELVCGNSDYTVTFAFDEEWAAESVKTAVFSYRKQGKDYFQETVFTGNVAEVPILSGISFVNVGVYAGNLMTTTGAVVICTKSILCGKGRHEDPPEDVYNQLLGLLNDIADMTPFIGEDGNWWIRETDTGVQAQGEKGDQGEKGEQGIQGIQGEKGEKGDQGEQGIQGEQGEKGDTGENGKDGADGKDGFSPTVTITEITGGHQVSITDASGTKTFDVMDGQDGSGGGSVTVDDALSETSENPVQNKVIYAQLVQANTVLGQLQASIPTDAHINGLIDTYLSEALGGDY